MVQFSIRTIEKKDNTDIARVVREVSFEHGLAGPGYGVSDPTVDDFFSIYSGSNAQYWVVEDPTGKVYGGGGVSPLMGDSSILEIQKMYLSKEVRGLGFAKKILLLCEDFAREHNYSSLYLETTHKLTAAYELYKYMGYEVVDVPRGNTGHSDKCEIWMIKHV